MTIGKEKTESQIKGQNIDFKNALTKNLEGYDLIFKIENILRFFILNKMHELKNSRWWKSLSNPRVKDTVEAVIKIECKKKLLKEKESDGNNFVLMHEIYYTNTEDLFLIMRENWDTFGEYFGKNNQIEFDSDLKKIIRIRNKVMHSKPILKREIHDLDYFCNNLMKKIDITDKDHGIFYNSYLQGEIISDFSSELLNHIQIVDKNLNQVFLTDIYESINSEWWYKDYLDIDTDNCDKYYNDIDHINKLIKKQERGSKYDIQNMIKSKNILERCQDILSSIDAQSI